MLEHIVIRGNEIFGDMKFLAREASKE